MSSKPTTPGHGEDPALPVRPSAPTSDDLREYLPPDDAATEAMLDAAMAKPRGVPSPELIERLKQLDEAEEAAQKGAPSPWAKGRGGAGIDRAALPSAARPSDAAAEEQAAPTSRRPARRPRVWWVFAAVAAVFVPVIVTIVVLRGEKTPPSVAPVVEASTTMTAGIGTGTSTPAPRGTASGDAGAAVDASVAPEIKPSKKSSRAPGSSGAAVPTLSVTATASPAPTVSPELLQ